MRIVEQTPTKLTLETRPAWAFIFGSILVILGVLLINYGFGIALLTFGVIFVFGASAYSFVETWTFDRIQGTFTLIRQGWLGSEFIQYEIDKIADINIGGYNFYVGNTYDASIVQVSGKNRYLGFYYTPNKKNQEEHTLYIREFLSRAC